MVVDLVGHSTPCKHLNARMLCLHFCTRLRLDRCWVIWHSQIQTHFAGSQTTKDDNLRHWVSNRYREVSADKKKRGPFASLVSQSGLRQHHTGAPAAYCFDIHARRASRTTRLSAPEHHRYVRVLDWKVAHECQKAGCSGVENRLQVQAGVEVQIIFEICERLKWATSNSSRCCG